MVKARVDMQAVFLRLEAPICPPHKRSIYARLQKQWTKLERAVHQG